jgi:hypothetical protein
MKGGKYVVIDLKHIPQDGTCCMDKDATIFRVGSGATEGTIRVRYEAPQLSSGGCPLRIGRSFLIEDGLRGRCSLATDAWIERLPIWRRCPKITLRV